MSLTKVSYSMIQGESANVLDYGADSSGVSDSTAAIQAAINAGKGSVFIPAGTYAINDTIQVGNQLVYGQGIDTKIESSATGVAFNIGKTAPTTGISTGGCVCNMSLEIKTSAGIGIRLLQTQNAYVENVYIYSDVARPHTAIGVQLDGGNVSGYFNYIKNVNCVGVDVGYIHTSTGSGFLTSNTFVDCSALCYTNNTNSIGHAFNGNNGLDSIFIGGNLESCKKGIRMATDANWAAARTQGTSWFGQRFEANSVCDIDWGNGGYRNSFYGYGNYGNSSVPGFNASLNYDAVKENLIGGSANGSWTPALSSTGATFSYTTQAGYFSFAGNLLTVTCTIVASATGTLTNPLSITGLPFTSKAGVAQSGVVGYCQGASNTVTAYLPSASTSVQLYENGSTNLTPNAIGMSGSREIDFTITYLI